MNEHILNRIVRPDGKHLVYYREIESYPYDIKTRVEVYSKKQFIYIINQIATEL